MAVQTQKFTVGDILRGPQAILQDANGAAIDISLISGATVKFRMVKADKSGTVKVNDKAANIDDASNGKVSYDWDAADVDTAFVYWAWFILIDGGGQEEHFPTGYDYKVEIWPKDGTALPTS